MGPQRGAWADPQDFLKAAEHCPESSEALLEVVVVVCCLSFNSFYFELILHLQKSFYTCYPASLVLTSYISQCHSQHQEINMDAVSTIN